MADRNSASNDSEEGDLLPGSDERKKLTEEDIFAFSRWSKSIRVYEIHRNAYIKISTLKTKPFENSRRLTSDGIRKLKLHSVRSSLSKELKKDGKSR